ncbi:MAG: hypothetical protein ABSH56_05970 [Bryobacteraceae bacterium]
MQAGVLVTRSAHGLEFRQAAAIAINGSDRALILGLEPILSAATLPATTPEITLWKDATGAVAAEVDGEPRYLLPYDWKPGAAANLPAAWRQARIAYRKSVDAQPIPVAFADFVAFLPGGVAELARRSADQRWIERLGGATEIEWIGAAARAFPSDPAIAALAGFVERAMRQQFDRFQSGAAGLDALRQALAFGALAVRLYPDRPAPLALFRQLQETQRSTERQAAILRAFAAGREWDAFLLADRDFERFEDAYPDIAGLRTEALRGSLELHRRAGETFLEERAYQPAWRELQQASARRPSDRALAGQLAIAWEKYSRQAAEARQGSRQPLDSAQTAPLAQALEAAAGFRQANQFGDAQKSLLRAEAIDPDSLPLLLEKTKLLAAAGDFNHALATLDRYDLRATGPQRQAGAALRTELLGQRAGRLRDLEAQAAKAWAEGSYYGVRSLAIAGLRAQNDAIDLLSFGGRASLIVRDTRDARGFFQQYLDASNTLDTGPRERAEVRTWLALTALAATEPESGDRSWFSGKRLPPGIAYCPISLAFQAKIDHIDLAEGKRVTFTWQGDRLQSISGRQSIVFQYQDLTPQVFFVAAGGEAVPKIPGDPDEAYRRTPVLLLNNPLVDPLAMRRVTGRNPAVTVAGNSFFDPFVWNGLHYFSIEYDDAGRVARAVEIAGPKGNAVNHTELEFDWDGPKLAAIRAYRDIEGRRRRIYRRTLRYEDGRLAGESIEVPSGFSSIRYRYDNGRLVSAACDADPTLGEPARQVTFR